MTLHQPPTEYVQSRRARLTEAMRAENVEAVLVTDLVNVRYLTGFTGSNGAALVDAKGATWLATDNRYELQAAEQSPDSTLLIERTPIAALAEICLAQPIQRVGFEDQNLTVADFAKLTADAPIEWVGVGELVQQLRAKKDEFELGLLRQACTATSSALENVLPQIGVGVTELEVARLLDDAMRDLGTDGPGFETIVATGPHSAVPHHEPTDRRIESGDFVKMDFGARVGGYHADMTRTIIVGEPQPWQQEIYELVARAQQAGRDALTPGVAAVDVDRAAREVIAAAGFGDQFGHGLGHGVGLEIHEVPFLGATSTDRIEATVPVTVEPGVYLPGRGGVRIEDTVVVHHDRVEILTLFPRDLIVVA